MNRIVLDVPRWHVFLHREARGIDPVAEKDAPLRRFEDELFDRLYSGEGERLPEDQQDRELGPWADAVHQTCTDLPAFQRLTSEVFGDAFLAGMAVDELMATLEPQLPEEPQAPPEAQLRRGLGAACRKASDAVEAQREAMDGISGVGLPGMGTASGANLPAKAIRDLAGRLRSDARLRQIALLAGRFKRIAASKRREKVKRGAEEISNIGPGADLARLLPSELQKVSHPALRRVFFAGLVEKTLMTYELSGREPTGRGPFVVVLDKSGSMEGSRDVWATALALALLDQAQHERRPFALLGFDYRVKFEAVVPVGSPLPDTGLFVGCGGGTDIGTALRRGLAIIAEKSTGMTKADVVLVTDGESDVSSAEAVREEAKKLGVTILGLGIGVGRGQLAPWCDDVHVVSDLTRIDDAAAERLFAA